MKHDHTFCSSQQVFSLTAMLGLLSACSQSTPIPVETTVCDLSSHVQRLVEVEAEISVDARGRTVIGDRRCDTELIELQLSGAAARAGVEGQLKAASLNAASSGKSTIPVKLTGVYTQASTGDYFIAESVSGLH